MNTLVREPVSEPECVDPLEEKFAKQCAVTLQYHRLDYNVAIAKSTTPIRNVLRELDIHPFTAESVRKYKESKAWWFNTLSTFDHVSFCIFIGGMITMVGGLIAAAGFGSVDFLPAAKACLGASVMGLVCLLTGLTLHVRSKVKRWLDHPLTNYKNPVPEFVLQTALDIKTKYPQAVFLVEELEISERPSDPFLVLVSSGKRFYLEVWNEPGFKQEREV